MKALRRLSLVFTVTLTIGSSTFAQKSDLTGTVYDANGAVVVKAKVRAIDTRGNKFETLTNDEGVYVLTLPFNKYEARIGFKESKYDLFVESAGFKRSETKGYVFIPSQFGKMTLDIALEVGSDNCGAGGCIETGPIVESKGTSPANIVIQPRTNPNKPT